MSETKEITVKVDKPKRVRFVIAANNPDDGRNGDHYIPGKSLGVSEFKRSYPLRCDQYGTRYVTGFEYDEVYYDDSIPTEFKESYQKDVRTARKWLERRFGSLDAERVEFWSKRKLVVDNLEKEYDTDKDDDLILYYNILGGGYPEIAKSHEDAEKYNKQLYLSVAQEEAMRKTSHRRNLRQAKSLLQDVYDKWTIEDTLYLCYYLTPKGQHGYTKNTSKDLIVGTIEDYVDGLDTATEKSLRPISFIDTIKAFKIPAEKDKIRVEGLFNAASYYSYIVYNSKEKTFLNRTTGFPYGSLKKDAVDKLLNPVNSEELSWLKKKVEQEKWVK